MMDIGQKGEDFAKVSDLRSLPDGRYVVVYAWLYTRDEIAQELQVNGKLPLHTEVHLDRMWPVNSEHKFMLVSPARYCVHS
jgi:hypothetical protein